MAAKSKNEKNGDRRNGKANKKRPKEFDQTKRRLVTKQAG